MDNLNNNKFDVSNNLLDAIAKKMIEEEEIRIKQEAILKEKFECESKMKVDMIQEREKRYFENIPSLRVMPIDDNGNIKR